MTGLKYLVTGGAGFIGCNAARRWMERGHEVVVMRVLAPTEIAFPCQEAALFHDVESGRELYVDPQLARERYRQYLSTRLETPRPFVAEAVRAREAALREPVRPLSARR